MKAGFIGSRDCLSGVLYKAVSLDSGALRGSRTAFSGILERGRPDAASDGKSSRRDSEKSE